MTSRAIALVLGLLAAPFAAQAKETLRIAVASNFAPTLEVLITAYKFSHPDAPQITLSTGSTGAHYALISRGAPFDLFFAADQTRPEKLVQNGKAVEQRLYAIGVPVLVLSPGDLINAQTPQDVAALLKGKTIAIADPALAPYGVAAMQAIKWAGLDPQSDLKLIFGANAGLAASLFALGTSDGAILSKSQLASIKTHRDFSAFELPETSLVPVYQNVALISERASTRRFYEWALYDPAAETLIREAGYHLLDATSDPTFMPTPIPQPNAKPSGAAPTGSASNQAAAQ